MKKTLIIVLGAMVLLVLVGVTNAKEIKTIKLDGSFSDWKNVPILLSRTQAQYPDFSGRTYYWNNDTDAWQTEALSDACMYNASRSLDLSKIKFANNKNYLYFYWEKNSDYTNYYWKTFPDDADSNVVDEQSLSPNGVETDPLNVRVPPCLGENLYLPVAFDHNKVFGFDTDLDMKFDYYLVLNIKIPDKTMNASIDTTVTSYIYKDKGNGRWDGAANEKLVTNLGSDFQMEVSATPCKNGVCQEGRIKINEFFTDLKIDWGDAVIVNYEAFSSRLFKTKRSVYAFNKKNKLGLKITWPKKRRMTAKKKKMVLRGKVKKGSTIKIYVNGKKKAVFKTDSKKFDTGKIKLPKKKNVIVIKAKKGKKKVVKGVFVKRK